MPKPRSIPRKGGKPVRDLKIGTNKRAPIPTANTSCPLGAICSDVSAGEVSCCLPSESLQKIRAINIHPSHSHDNVFSSATSDERKTKYSPAQRHHNQRNSERNCRGDKEVLQPTDSFFKSSTNFIKPERTNLSTPTAR